MGRQGGGGGHSSGGSRSHSGSRSHGSSRSHSSRGGGRSTGSSFSGSSFHIPRSTWRPGYTRSYRPYRTGHRTVVYPSGGSSIIGILVILVLLTAVLLPFFNGMKGGSNIAPSTIPRERLETQHAYVNDCVIDEISWINNPTKLSKELKQFYDKTGCQPFVYLKAYNADLTTATACEKFAQEYYDTTFADRQNTVLYMYFCDQYDEGEGISCLQIGADASVVMDSEAEEIFWNYEMSDWNSWDTNDNDGMFAHIFNSTAERIMHLTTTTKDVAKYAIIAVIAIVIVGGGITVLVLKYRRQRQEAQETIEILKTPIDTSDTIADDLADKYTGQDHQ